MPRVISVPSKKPSVACRRVVVRLAECGGGVEIAIPSVESFIYGDDRAFYKEQMALLARRRQFLTAIISCRAGIVSAIKKISMIDALLAKARSSPSKCLRRQGSRIKAEVSRVQLLKRQQQLKNIHNNRLERYRARILCNSKKISAIESNLLLQRQKLNAIVRKAYRHQNAFIHSEEQRLRQMNGNDGK